MRASCRPFEGTGADARRSVRNLGTLTHTWTYPHQAHGWTLAGFGKLGAWFLLPIVSYTLVALVNRPQPHPDLVTAPRAGFR